MVVGQIHWGLEDTPFGERHQLAHTEVVEILMWIKAMAQWGFVNSDASS